MCQLRRGSMTRLIGRRGLLSLWLLAILRLAAVGCAGPEPLRRRLSEDGGAGANTGAGGNTPSGAAGDITASGSAGTVGPDAGPSGGAGFQAAGVSGQAGA